MSKTKCSTITSIFAYYAEFLVGKDVFSEGRSNTIFPNTGNSKAGKSHPIIHFSLGLELAKLLCFRDTLCSPLFPVCHFTSLFTSFRFLFLSMQKKDVKVEIFPSRVAINPDTKFSFFCLLYVIARLLPLLVRQPKFYYLQEDQTQVARRRAVPKAKKSILVVMDGWKLAFALLLPKHNFKSPWGEGGRAI